MSARKHTNASKAKKPDLSNIARVKRISLIDICIVVSSLLAYLIDTVTDLLVAAQYLYASHYVWGTMTLAFVLLPAIIIQAFSGRWYAADNRMKGCRHWFTHIFLLQPLERYLYAVVSGLEARRSGDVDLINDYYYQHNDVSMLRLIEAFLESAPQLTLQLYIILCTDNAHWLTGTSAVVSLIAVGWAVAAYSHALRKAYRDTYTVSWPSLLLQTLWHIGVVAARVLALIIFTSVFRFWVCLVIGAHWMLMTIWVVLQNTDFCPSRCEEFLFDCTVGVVYNFSFFNLKEGHTRWRISAYFSLMFVENVVLVGVWYPYRSQAWYDIPLMVSVAALFVIGICCMMLYYRFCHPSGPIRCPKSQRKAKNLSFVDDFGVPLPRAPTYQSTPAVKQVKMPDPPGVLPVTPKMLPRTSTVSLPRKALLKSQLSSRLDVQYREVATPSQLSPIKACVSDSPASCHNVYADCTTLQLDQASAYRHFSVDASACFYVSRCHTLEGTGVDLSRAVILDKLPSARKLQVDPIPKFLDDDDHSLGSVLSYKDLNEDDSGDSFCLSSDGSPISSDPSSPRVGTDSGHCTENSLDKPGDSLYQTPIDLSLCEADSIPYIDASSLLLSPHRWHRTVNYRETHLIRDTDTL